MPAKRTAAEQAAYMRDYRARQKLEDPLTDSRGDRMSGTGVPPVPGFHNYYADWTATIQNIEPALAIRILDRLVTKRGGQR